MPALMIEMKVSDDAIRLYGFASAEEREWFRLLQTVQNVGAQGGAVGAVDAVSPRELQRALALSDKAMIGRAQGVGPKLALRIATELKDKAPADDAARRWRRHAHVPPRRAVPTPMRWRRWSSWAIPKARPPKRWRAPPTIWATTPRPVC